jgi:sugar phosphate isomerase/epimerase
LESQLDDLEIGGTAGLETCATTAAGNRFMRTQDSNHPGSQTTRRDFLRQSILAGSMCLAPFQSVGCRALGKESARRWQIGCYTRPWDQFDYRTALDGIANAGFKYCGIMTAKTKTWLILTVESSMDEAAEVGAEVRQRGLKCLSLYAGEFPAAKSVEAGSEGLHKLINLCSACGSSNLMLAGVGDERLYDAYFKVIAECCDYAAAKGIGLSMKPHGGFLATGVQCRKGVERVGHKNFRIWYDPGNIFYYSDGKLDPVEDAASVDGLVVGMSVKDFRMPKDVLVTPGTGLVNFRDVLTRLKLGGFTRGPLLVECLERGDAAKVTAEAGKAREFLESLTGQKA